MIDLYDATITMVETLQESSMPRYRGTHEGAGTVIGRLLILIATQKETSASLAEQLDVSPRQVNRYVRQLIEGGWQIERIGAWTKQDYYFELRSPRIVAGAARQRGAKQAKERGPKSKSSKR